MKTYTKKQIQEAIAYWEKKLTESPDNANLRFNPQLEQIASGFKPTEESICGMSVRQIMDGDLKTVAEELLRRYAESTGMTGKRYVPAAYSHAGYEHNNMLDVRFAVTDVKAGTFDARIVLAYVRDVKWVPDGNPYDGVSPEYIKTKMIHKILFKFKPDFQLLDLTRLDAMKCREASLLFSDLNFKDLNEDDKKKADILSLLTWMLRLDRPGWLFNIDNFFKFLNYAAAPVINRMLTTAQYVDADSVKDVVAKIRNIPGLADQLKHKDGNADADALFMRRRDSRREELKRKIRSRSLMQAAQNTMRQWEAEGRTFEEVSEFDDLFDVVGQSLGVDSIESFCTPDWGRSDLEMARDEEFSAGSYAEDLCQDLEDRLVDDMLERADEPFDAEAFNQMVSNRFDDSDMWNILDASDYIEKNPYYYD